MARLVGLRRRHFLSRPRPLATTLELLVAVFQRYSYTTTIASSSSYSSALEEEAEGRKKGRWLTLPPFAPPVDASTVGKAIASGRRPAGEDEPTTALKWVRRCCPYLPMSLVQKLFRLREVRRDLTKNGYRMDSYCARQQLRRVSAKDVMMSGDVILLPVTVQNVATKKYDYSESEEEISFIRSLELYKDTAIIAVNKPPGMPVQGGVGIKYSMDALAAKSLKYDYPESPRLVHRLDRDSSGVLVLGRTQTSALILHSIFREKTSGALSDDIKTTCRALQRKYLALVIGTPKHSKGLIAAPLTKIVLEDGKSERITIVKDIKSTSSHHALTEYQVIGSSAHGHGTGLIKWGSWSSVDCEHGVQAEMGRVMALLQSSLGAFVLMDLSSPLPLAGLLQLLEPSSSDPNGPSLFPSKHRPPHSLVSPNGPFLSPSSATAAPFLSPSKHRTPHSPAAPNGPFLSPSKRRTPHSLVAPNGPFLSPSSAAVAPFLSPSKRCPLHLTRSPQRPLPLSFLRSLNRVHVLSLQRDGQLDMARALPTNWKKASALGTPIVGDYKYGWYAHRKWDPMPWPESMSEDERLAKSKPPFGLELDGGSIAEKQPYLHLHCKQMILPNISTALWQLQSSSVDHDFSELEKLSLVAPLPLHMQVSWDILSCLP
ncbi:putative RNA pseudouridine synthase 4, mitochondrial-like [Cocos nucifera]|uniref:Putative RNA pseudouridine synthase 4, mitochondrial-like n=1 Tax=Cocos nucifera TaxID=13894 RepID=A0A8K0MUZ7_COCNU|nr:putative RNA pseudouridine synthase 4, mitochondrial-like [Cocos nucifera]